jgi:hypothetical protein
MQLQDRPKQFQADVAEIVQAFKDGGKALANRTFKAMCEARYKDWGQFPLSDAVRDQLMANAGIAGKKAAAQSSR